MHTMLREAPKRHRRPAQEAGAFNEEGMNMKKILAAAGIGAALIAGPLLDISPAHADVFTMCPSGHEGVVGGHTTCAFAENVERVFYASGMTNDFTAYSPITAENYPITCMGRYSAIFETGETLISTRCYGGDGAEVVIW
jgi:hypothetical protein